MQQYDVLVFVGLKYFYFALHGLVNVCVCVLGLLEPLDGHESAAFSVLRFKHLAVGAFSDQL
jgi:hypothetical protein